MIIFWHRRDLRINDNAGLYKALNTGEVVQPIFIFDKAILNELPNDDQRVLFIHREVKRLKKKYQSLGSDLRVFYEEPITVFKILVEEDKRLISRVYTNRDYEPYARERDRTINDYLQLNNIPFIGAKDHVVFEKNEVIKEDGSPYKVFTPYMKKWKNQLNDIHLEDFFVEKKTAFLLKTSRKTPLISLEKMGFSSVKKVFFPSQELNESIIKEYDKTRDFPAIEGTTRISLHLRFGTISIRDVVKKARLNEKFLNELIWRDFYQMIIYHFPHSVYKSFKPNYDAIPWENNEELFQLWCRGKTGYPIVDAGMRELNQTGFMHNRVRMITASFLTKHLLIDWRRGEAYFAKKLLDFELASNVGGWQWAASSGVDAQPYFRVFNPYLQQDKFDKKKAYIKKWIPEYGTKKYPQPIVNHKEARQKAIQVFKNNT